MTTRRLLGLFRLLAGIVTGAVLVLQIVQQQQIGTLAPEYFAFFTIDTGILATIVLNAGGLWALTDARDTRLLTTAAMAVVPYAIVTGIVYFAMTIGQPVDTRFGMPWLNGTLHVWLPAYLALDWFVATWLVPGRARLGWSALLAAVAFPALWVAFTLIRGSVDGYYPYAFLDPATVGAGAVALWVVGLIAFILVLAAACIAITRIRTHRRPTGRE